MTTAPASDQQRLEGTLAVTPEGMESRLRDITWRRKYILMDMTSEMVRVWLEVTDTILLPAGSTEQHGAHLPLGTDAYQAMLMACAIAERANLPIAPLVWAGLAPYHMGRPGTITLRYETYVSFVTDVCRSLIHHGFKRIIVSLNHKGNAAAMAHVARKIRYETGALVVVLRGEGLLGKTMQELFAFPESEKRQKVRHGGELETSRILYWNPELVDMTRAEPHPMDTPSHYPSSFKALSHEYVAFDEGEIELALDFDEVASAGTLGNPRKASFEAGRVLTEEVAEYYARAIEEIKKIPVEVQRREFTERL